MVMRNYFMKIILAVSVLMVLSACSLDTIILNKKEPVKKEVHESTDTADNLFTSKDDSVYIYLPDKSWVNSADTDKKRIFIAANKGMITIEHMTDSLAESKTLPQTKRQMEKYIENLENAFASSSEEDFTFEIVDWKIEDYNFSKTYYCEVKVTSQNQTRYEVLYGVKTEEEVYEVLGRAYLEDESLQAEIKEAVKSVSINKKGYQGLVMEEDGSGNKGKKYICTHAVNVRDQAQSSDSTVIGTIEEGETVTVVSKEGNWYKIRFEGQTGYVYKEYLEKKE